MRVEYLNGDSTGCIRLSATADGASETGSGTAGSLPSRYTFRFSREYRFAGSARMLRLPNDWRLKSTGP